MWLILAIAIGIALGITSHIRGGWLEKVEGVAEGLAVITGSAWLFVSLGIWWWVSIVLAILTFALYLLVLQALTQKEWGNFVPKAQK